MPSLVAQQLHTALEEAISRPWTTIGVLVIFFLALLPITKLLSVIRFRKALKAAPKEANVIPVVPYWIPGLRHLIPFILDSSTFTYNVVKHYGWERPLMLKALNINFMITANPDHIVAIFKQTRFLSARSITARSARYLLDIPASIMPYYQADDSGMAAHPRKGSTVAEHDRILYHQTRTSQKFLASPYLEPLSRRFADMLHTHVEALAIGSDWVRHDDLFAFLQETVSKANIEAIMGSEILAMHPSLTKDFWAAKNCSPEYFQGWPRWLIPDAFRRRDRVINAIQAWHARAFATSDHTNTGPDDPDWEPIWGSKYAKMRLQYMLAMKPLTDRVRACEDWGLMFGSNANTLPAVFWYLYEALRDPSLAARMRAEAASCTSPDGTLRIDALASQPLLQSAFAETLRMRVSILVSRMVEFGNVSFDSYTASPGEYVLMPTDALHYNREAWERAGRTPTTPLETFDAERFLVSAEEGGREFSLQGLEGLWIPFGGGDRMCPGRHLTKLEMLITFAYLFERYEVEMEEEDGGGVRNDERFAPFGALPPDRKVPFKIRRRAEK